MVGRSQSADAALDLTSALNRLCEARGQPSGCVQKLNSRPQAQKSMEDASRHEAAGLGGAKLRGADLVSLEALHPAHQTAGIGRIGWNSSSTRGRRRALCGRPFGLKAYSVDNGIG